MKTFADIALRDTEIDVVRTAVDVSRRVLGVDAAFAAMADDAGGLRMELENGIRHEEFMELRVLAGLGLGGQVVDSASSLVVHDYAHEPSITADYVPVISREGLRGIACVPVIGPQGVQALIYAAMRTFGAPGDVAVRQLEQIASFAGIGLHHAAARARERELAILRERERLATSLHDSVAQMLFAIGVAAQRSRTTDDPAAAAEHIRDIEATAATAREELRSTLADLARPAEGLAFEAMFESELRLFEQQTGLGVWLTREGAPRDLPRVTEVLLLDTAREGLRNAAKHGCGRTVHAHLAYRPADVLLALQTETAGTAGGPAAGSGLGVLAARARALHGVLEFSVADDGVASLRVRIPAPQGFGATA